ncbi:hypothetical protein [Desulfosporosinus sp. OT]|uniref:hypothetical protein n=1 Tax=Desulfosporosinus sp. OT TaxID=913865 RepID=UPI000223A7A0|nr:hypothetical protein [Desulfosporosinus sp. OT]EGW38458.1 hypothetical protein DOT_3742 [Desulfosporosinus sp. OT]
MKNYVKPLFEYVTLTVEEKFANGSPTCTIFGSCPTDCDSFTVGGVTINRNFHAH